MEKRIKSEKGVTLLGLTVYILTLSIVVGILASISSFFYGNVNLVIDSSRFAAEFNKFNVNFVNDAKKNNHANVKNGNTVIFEDGTTYVYNEEDKGIYRGQVKIATNVQVFNASKKTITINNVDKDIITIDISVGNYNNRTLFIKKIDYTLKYW